MGFKPYLQSWKESQQRVHPGPSIQHWFMNMNIKKERWLANVSHYGIVVLTNKINLLLFCYQCVLQDRFRSRAYGILFQWKDQYYTLNRYCIWQYRVVSSLANQKGISYHNAPQYCTCYTSHIFQVTHIKRYTQKP